jgi:mono/diheme cytochrome c family protein
MNIKHRSVLFAAALLAAPMVHAADAPSRGREVFETWCVHCHGAGALPGTIALGIKYRGTVPAELLQRTDLLPEFVGVIVRNGISFMPFFRKTEISDADLRALEAFLSSPH